MTDNNHHNSGHVAVWVKAPPTIQELLVKSAPARFFKPPYVGDKGWVGVRLDGHVDWKEVAGILKDGYLMSTPPAQRRKRAKPNAESTSESKPRRARR
jgi:hypothetical protein